MYVHIPLTARGGGTPPHISRHEIPRNKSRDFYVRFQKAADTRLCVARVRIWREPHV